MKNLLLCLLLGSALGAALGGLYAAEVHRERYEALLLKTSTIDNECDRCPRVKYQFDIETFEELCRIHALSQ